MDMLESKQAEVANMLAIAGGGTFVPCGSRHVCDPPVYTTDEDYMIRPVTDMTQVLKDNGYVDETPGSEYGKKGSEFESWRKGDVNLIVIYELFYADRYQLATKLCKQFNLLKKQDRIALYDAIIYGE